MLFSSRRNIQYPNPLRGDTSDVPRDFGAVVAALEVDVIYGQGTFAARPVSTGGSPGMQGRIYVATDATPHGFYYDYGTGWDPIGSLGAGTVGTAQIADGAVTTIKIADANVTLAKLAANSVDSSKIVDASILATDLADAIVPSRGAANGTEALRAIGAGAGQVVAGNDARLTDVRAPSVGHDPAAYGTVLPTTGLYNGYFFILFVSDPVAGSLAWECTYRADLDGTRPWHVAACPIIQYGSAGVHTTSAYSVASVVLTFTAPRNGVYGYSYYNSFESNGSTPQHRITIAGSTGGFGSRPFAGRATLTAGQTIYVEHSNDFNNISLSDSSEYGWGTFYPQKII